MLSEAYGNVAKYEVIIVESDALYGSDDYYDPPEIADNKEIKCYYSWFDSPHERRIFKTGCGAYMSIEEATHDIKILSNVDWSD